MLSDGNIRYYEYENDKFEYLSEYKSGDPQRGIAFLPKRGVNLHDNEITRARAHAAAVSARECSGTEDGIRSGYELMQRERSRATRQTVPNS